MRRRALLALVGAVAAAAIALPILTGGGEEAGGRNLPGSLAAGQGGGLSQAPRADCEGWNAGTPSQRRDAVADIDAAFSRNGKGATLPAGEAAAVFDRACAEDFAGPFKLWKLYEHALAFQYGERPGH